MPPELFISYKIVAKAEFDDFPFSYLYDIGTFMYELDEYLASLAEVLQLFLLELRASMLTNITTENMALLNQLWEDEDWVFYFPEDETHAKASVKISTPLLIDHRDEIEEYIQRRLNQKLTESPIELTLVFQYIGNHAG